MVAVRPRQDPSEPPAAPLRGPLDGIRILAFEQYGAGPFGTQHLADLGAEVIKVENRRLGGDYARALGPHFAEGDSRTDTSLFFQSLNRNKKSLSLDLAHPDGRAVLQRLVKSAHGVVNNLRGDVPERLGLTYDALKAHNRAIVCAHCSAYGREGPRRAWPGYDFLMQAETGYFHMSGEPGSPPTRMGLSIVDFLGGTYMALGLLAGINGARTTGQGRDIDVNLFDAAMTNFSYMAQWALNTDYAPERVDRSAHASMVPCQLYRTQDGWIFIMCNKEKFWQLLCDEIERPDLAQDTRFASFADRLLARDLLTDLLDGILQRRSTADWLTRFAGKIPASPVKTPRQALEDLLLQAPDKVETMTLDNGATLRSLRGIFATDNSAPSRPCPELGADTREILKGMGYYDYEIDRFEQSGAI